MIIDKIYTTKAIGAQAESLACDYLQDNGLQKVCRNWRVKGGEIDLIMKDKGVLVFIEVKYRKNLGYGCAVEQWSDAQQRRLRLSASLYLQKYYGDREPPSRIDVLGIYGKIHGQHTFNWIKDAI